MPTAEDAAVETPDADANTVTLESEHADSVPAREAAKWRGRLRRVEAERDQLTERVTAMQRAQAEQLISSHGLRPGAVWAVAKLDDLLDEHGDIDPAKVKTGHRAGLRGVRHRQPAETTRSSRRIDQRGISAPRTCQQVARSFRTTRPQELKR